MIWLVTLHVYETEMRMLEILTSGRDTTERLREREFVIVSQKKQCRRAVHYAVATWNHVNLGLLWLHLK
jgi:hypothetical protein